MDDYAQGQAGQVFANPDVPAGEFSLDLVKDMKQTLDGLRPDFEMAYDYVHGDHLLPYAPRDTTEQIRDLQRRSVANMMPLLVNLPSQMSFVDDYRRHLADGSMQNSKKFRKSAGENPEWGLWQKNRMDGRQAIIYRALLTYGHAFVVVNNTDPKNIRFDILSTRNTVAYFRDPVNDIRPSHVLSIVSYPRKALGRATMIDGLAILWDDKYRWEMTFNSDGDFIVKGKPFAHKLEHCPVVRYTCFIDDEGHTMGVVLPAVTLQDRLNQATFSTNVTADFGAFKVRYAAGLVPNYKTDPTTGEVLLDANGEPIPERVQISQAQLLMSDDPATKFGQLDETPLDGYLRQEEQAQRNFTMISQFPPLASISNLANLSAEAWAAAEAQFIRWIDSLHISLGESHEELFRTAALALGDKEGAESYGGEVRWRDMTTKSTGVQMDGLAKTAQFLGAPNEGLWEELPGMTNGKMADWRELRKQQDAHEQEMAQQDPGVQQATAAAAQKKKVGGVPGQGTNGNRSK